MSNYWKKKLEELTEEEKNKTLKTSQESSTPSNYWQQKLDELEESERKKNTTTTAKDDDIAPVTITEEDRNRLKSLKGFDEEEDDERTWFQKGAFEDGYQFGDVLRSISASSEDLANNVMAGILGIGEKVVDAGAYVVGATGKLFGADEFAEKTKDFIAKDLYDEKELAKKLDLVGNPIYALTTKKILGIDEDKDSVFGDKTDSVAQSGGQLITQIGLQAVGVPWFVTSGVTSFGSEVEGAFNEGATYGEAGLSGAITAGAEILTEKLSGGIKFGNMGTLDDGLTKALARGISNKFVRSAAKLGMDVVGEGAEEWLSEDIGRFGQWLTYQDDKTLTEMLWSEEAMEAKIEAFIGGGMLGGVGSVTQGIQAKAKGVDATSGLTANEEAVFKKIFEDRVAEAEKNGEKLTLGEKTKLHNEILEQMEKGYISTDTIEEVLGGETYKNYKDTVDSEEAILKEFEELGNKQNPTLAEQTRYVELKAKVEEIKNSTQRKDLKTKLSEEVFSLAKDSKLAESYYEGARRGQAFEADLSQYDDTQKATIQSAIDSGILNNSRKTHEFVDFVAKISADKGVSFNFADNEKIANTSFAVEGAIVNGYKVTNEDGSIGITVNIESPKYLNSVVGHEVTHVLEGTELYGELQKTLFEYAKSKGEYDSRRAALGELYAEKDIDTELTADLVGDYLFTDSDFINNLSTKNRNVFQKIYDEIKYLCKVATAGSKEARELEKVKKAFEKAYKESGKASAKTEYSLTPVEAVQPKSNKWNRTLTTEEAKARFPKLWDVTADESEARNPTQISSTVNSYRKVYNFLQNEGFDGTILDASSGLGYGTKAGIEEYGFDVEDIEPYPDKSYNPKYKDYSALDKKYDVVISNAVLNVLPQDQRDALVVKMGEMLNDGGRIFINVRGKDVDTLASNSNNTNISPMEWFVDSTGSYQKGFTKPELVAYLQDALGEGFTVKPTNMFGAVSAIVTKDSGVKYSLSDSNGKKLTKEQGEYFKDSKVRDENGNLKVMYHGSQDAGFHIFDSSMSDDDTSFFFVDRNDVAATYSGTSETYAAPTFHTAEDFNKFFAENGMNEYSVKEEMHGEYKWFVLYENGSEIASSETAKMLYDEFRDWTGLGEGEANYKVYLNLTNPLVVDAEGRNWNRISGEFSQEVYDRYQTLTAEEKTALTQLAAWEDASIFRDEIETAVESVERGANYVDDYIRNLASAANKLGDADMYRLFDIATDNFSEESLRENAVKYLKTRDFAQRAKEQGYDGVIFKNIVDNGGFADGTEGASTVAIAFESNQIKSVANEKPTGDADIRYSLSEDNDSYSRIYDMQVEVNNLRKSISEFEASDDFKSHMSELSEAISNNDIDNGIKAYKEWREKSGYDALINKRDSLQAELDKLRKEYDDNLTNRELEKEQAAIAKSGLSEADYFRKQAVKEFGYTPYFYDAGYITPNGKMLNFSGEKGYHYGGRGQDHRAIGVIYADTNGSDALNRFVKDGNIRIMAESPGIDISSVAEPTKEQYATIRKFINEYSDKGFFNVDLTDENGRVIGTLQYENRINSTRIINDIKHYYETGEIREQSNVDRFRYSLSLDSEGRELSQAVKNRFGNSKVVDENGSLKVVYHGTATGEFTVFDKSKGSVEGDFGSGFYFTDNEADVSEHYEGGGPDFENKVARRAEQIEMDEEIDYDEAEQRAREELYKGGHKFEVYLNIENPAVVGETMLFDSESYYEQYNRDDYDSDEDYEGDVEQLLIDDVDNILWEIDNKLDVYSTEGIANVLYEAFYNGGIGIEELKKQINDLYLENNNGELVGNEVTRQIIESLGYDGIIDPTVSGKWNMEMEEGTTHYIVFKPNQIKAVTNQNPTDNPDINLSLSKDGETPKRYGNYAVSGKDIALEKAPVQEDIAPVEEVAPVGENVAEKPQPNLPIDYTDYSPVVDEKAELEAEIERIGAEMEALKNELDKLAVQANQQTVTWDEFNAKVDEIGPRWDELNKQRDSLIDEVIEFEKAEAALQRERTDSLTYAEAPPEMEAPYYAQREAVTLDNNALTEITKEVADILYLDAEESQEMAETIQRFAQNENLTESELFEEIKNNFLYHEEIDNSDEKDLLSRAKKFMKGTKLYVPPHLKGDFNGRRRDGYNAFRREHFGHFHLTTNEASNAMGVDQFYGDLNEMFPMFFPDDAINPADQLKIMGDVANMVIEPEYRSGPYNDETIQEVCDTISNGLARYSEGERQRYSEEARKSFYEQADDYAPVAEDTAPVVENVATPDAAPDKTYEAIRPKKSKEPKMIRVKPDSETKEKLQSLYNNGKNGNNGSKPTAEKVAQIYDNEPDAPKEKGSGWSWFMRNFVDKHHIFEKLALKTKNRELMAKADQMHRAESSAQWLIGHGKGKVKALNDIRKEVESSGLTKQFYEYMYHALNVDRMTLEERYEGAKNKAVYGDSVTADISRRTVAKLEAKYPQFKKWAKSVYDYNTLLRNELVKNGVISQETADLWAEMYPHYVPIRRVGDSGININVPLDTGRTGINAPVKRATGGNSDILPLFDTMAMRTEQTFKAVAKNRFGVELKNTLGTTIDKQSADLDEVIEGIEKHEELLKKGENGQNPTFTVFENGEKVTFEISEDMYEALKPAEGIVTKNSKTLNKLNNFRRGLITEYNPVFMATNAVKDAQDILINSQHAAKTYMSIPKAIKELATKGKWYTEYMENGGEQNTYFDGQKNTFTKEDTGFKKLIGMPLRAIKAANNFVERAPRLAEYIASRESGASVDVAMLDAARVTTNFAAGGDVTKWANRNGATFLNASVQGAAQQVRNIREAKANGLKGWVQLATKAAIAGIPAMILNGLLWDDDEEYEELSDYVKDNYYIVAKYGDGQFVRIPKGRAVAVIQDAFEQMGNAITGNDEVDLANFCELVISNLAPNNPLDNNIISPLIQAAGNKTWYGEDLVPSRLQDLPASEQFDESTDSISKWLGETFNISPIKLNYLLDQYSGGVGDVFLPMLTPEAESGDNSLVGNLVAPFKDKFTTDSVMNNQNVADFYDTKDKLTVNAKASTATDEDVLMSKYINSVSSELGELYGLKREVQNSDLPDDRKYEKVRDIQDEINALARESLSTYENVYIDGDYAEIGDRQYRLNDEGEWTKISDKQYEKQEDVTDELGISASDYWSNKSEYDFAYQNPEKYAVAKSVGGYDFYKSYMSDLYDIKADKDKSGKSIRGSRKEKVAEYVNSLDIDYGERLILFKGEYKADDTYNMEIIDYLNNREDISYDEMVSILKELGFEVDSEGNITWD
ncbi:MAG: hypothetical protein IKB02_05460 [Clostridia bacterium]|nr:hypothetical protein [Clostridia bacterium]MBR2388198.1 hypothetical protein [Clostridia bacterium]